MELRKRNVQHRDASEKPPFSTETAESVPKTDQSQRGSSEHLTSAQRISHQIESSPIGELWLQTIRKPNRTGHRAVGIDREITAENIKIAFKLLPLLVRPVLAGLAGPKRNAFVGFLVRKLLMGLEPAAGIWVQSQLMDLVQVSMSTGYVNWTQMAYLTVLNLIFSSFRDIYRYLAEMSDADVECDMNEGMERAYMSAQMSLSMPSLASAVVEAVMYEGSVFISMRPFRRRDGSYSMQQGPFNNVEDLLESIHSVTRIVSLSALLVGTILGASQGVSRWVFVALCVGPTVFRLLGGLFFNLTPNRTHRRHMARSDLTSQEKWLKEVGGIGPYKQETVLFGLRDWVLNRLDGVRREMRAGARESMAVNRATNLYLGIGQNSIEAVLYLVMVSRMFGNAISFGTARLCQAVAADLARALNTFGEDMERSFQSIFYLAAFVECTNLPHDLYASPSVDTVQLDAVRPSSGGLEIVARNLSFTYARKSKPTLHDINLTIPAGQTLAIVGFNGGGKTTLVKVLMGLYDYQGELYVNGVSAKTVDKQSLYTRTSCLFQDFKRYPATLRENVGVGRVDKMDHEESIRLAMQRGKADAVAKYLGGLDEMLGIQGTLGRNPAVDSDDEEDQAEVSSQTKRTTVKAGDGPNNSKKSSAEVADGEKQETKDAQQSQPKADNKAKKGEVTYNTLSGGQWQRVALARAFLRAEDADLVVFDEPSSSLDPRAEAALFERIHTLSTSAKQKPTTIYISHRFSTVRKAEQIAVVEDGTTIELGSHAELMRRDGRYAELFNLQKEGYESD